MMGKKIAILAVEILAACGLLLGQGVNSSILGRVTDTTGAPVPGVKITVTNTQTGIAVHAVTGKAGNYSVPELISGTYAVMGTKQGFERRTVSGIQVLSSSHVRVDLVLKVGSITQHISVVGRSPLIQTDATNISSSVTTRQLNNLPTDLQTIDTFVGLAAGVQSLNGDANNPPIAGSTHWGSIHVTVNGVGADQPGNGGGADVQNVGMLVLPPPSSLKELKVQSVDMSAKYKGKANINMVMKNGTNHLHGQLYEFVQNRIGNANTFLNNAKGLPRPPQHLNQFGGNIGGPIKRGKAFFFFDFSGYRNQSFATAQHNYPSMAERSGDFSALCTAPTRGGTFDANGVCSNSKYQLYNPFTGDPYPNNMIPTGSAPGDITSQAQALLKYLPAPTDASSPGLPGEANNYIGIIPQKRVANAYDLRIDYNLSQKDRLFGVWSQRNADPWNVAQAAYNPNYGSGRYFYKRYTLTGSETHTFSANTINSFRVAWEDYIQRFSGQNTDFSLQSLIPQTPPTVFNGLPLVTTTGYANLFHDIGSALPTPQYSVEFTDDFTHIHGNHTIQAGVDETGYKIFSRHTTGTNTGKLIFKGLWTARDGWPDTSTYVASQGNAIADFLIGTPNTFDTPGTGVFAKMIYSRQWGAYVQDIWQAKPNLTINYGLRYEYQTPWRYRNPETTTFSLTATQPQCNGGASTGSYVLPQNSNTPTLPSSGANATLFNAYLPCTTTTQALGESLNYIQADTNNFAPRVGIAWRPFGGTRTVVRAGYGVYYNMAVAYVGGRNEAWNPPWVVGITLPFVTDRPNHKKINSSGNAYTPDITYSNPFPGSNSKFPVPAHPKVIWLQNDFKDAVIQEWNLTVQHQFGANWEARISYVGNQSHHLPTNADNINQPFVQDPNATNAQAQNPYQPWGVINTWRSAMKQNFNQLQLGVKHRFASGFSINANYQYSRSLDNAVNPQNWHYPNLDYANTSFIHRHYAVFDYIYQLPLGRGRRWFSGAHGVGQAVAGGWQISGITHYASGLPFTVAASKAGVSGVSAWTPGRADLVSGANSYVYAGQQSGHDIVDGVQWFNPAAFTTPAQFTWGNSSRDSVWGPGYWNWDMSAMKTFQLREGLRLQFRSDFLDAFNHMNLGSPNASIPDLRDNGTNNLKVGKIYSGSDYRRIQFALKLMF